MALREDLAQKSVRLKRRAVGVVLPLSGLRAEEGRRVLAAVKLALGGAGDPGQAPALHPLDSRSEPLAADRAVEALVERHQVALVIGPLDGLAALAAARRAQHLQVPIICLSPEPMLAEVGPFVFRHHPTLGDQVAAVMGRVAGEGARRVSLLAPDNAQGRELHETLRAWLDRERPPAASGQGRELALVSPLFYRPGSVWQADLRRLLGPVPDRGGGERPSLRFDRLWLAGPLDEVEHLVPRLGYYGVAGRHLLGTLDWHRPKLLACCGKLLEGCLFADVFDPASPEEEVQRFVRSFQEQTGLEPGLKEALGYDAGLMARAVLDRAAPGATRLDLRRALAGLRGVEGACGSLAMGPDQRVRAPLKLFSVREGRFVSLGPAISRARGRPGPGLAKQRYRLTFTAQ